MFVWRKRSREKEEEGEKNNADLRVWDLPDKSEYITWRCFEGVFRNKEKKNANFTEQEIEQTARVRRP